MAIVHESITFLLSFYPWYRVSTARDQGIFKREKKESGKKFPSRLKTFQITRKHLCKSVYMATELHFEIFIYYINLVPISAFHRKNTPCTLNISFSLSISLVIVTVYFLLLFLFGGSQHPFTTFATLNFWKASWESTIDREQNLWKHASTFPLSLSLSTREFHA